MVNVLEVICYGISRLIRVCKVSQKTGSDGMYYFEQLNQYEN